MGCGHTSDTGDSFASLVNSHAPCSAFLEWLSAYQKQKGLSFETWMEVAAPVAQAVTGLEWITEPHRTAVQWEIVEFVKRAFTILWRPYQRIPIDLREVFQDFMTWVESQPDHTVVEFCWDLLADDLSYTPEPVRWMKWDGRLSGAISFESLNLGVSLAEEADRMIWWPRERWSVAAWDQASAPFLALLHHSSYLVRGAAALAVGRLYLHLETQTEIRTAPPLSEILMTIQRHEMLAAGVAGGFLQGMNWSIEPEAWSSFDGGVDMKSWFMATLRKSGKEPWMPHIQTFEFYAHELFAGEENAIREFLSMGRNMLAVMTATEDPATIPQLLPILQEMSASSDLAMAAAIREYLSVQLPYAGMEHMERA